MTKVLLASPNGGIKEINAFIEKRLQDMKSIHESKKYNDAHYGEKVNKIHSKFFLNDIKYSFCWQTYFILIKKTISFIGS